MKCPKCGKESKWNRESKMYKKATEQASKLLPALKMVCDIAKNYCRVCWKKELMTSAQTVLEGYNPL